MTGINNRSDINNEHEAAIKRYRKIAMFDFLDASLSEIMASVEDYKACSTEFKQFVMTKNVEGLLSVISEIGKVDIRNADTIISIIASQIEKT